MGRERLRHHVRLLALPLATVIAATLAGPPSLTLGLSHDVARGHELGAGIVRVDVGWPAARRPVAASEPADPAYDWTNADAAVDAARADGLEVLATFTRLPAWAHHPRAADFGAYGEALARHFADRVGAFQAWSRPSSRVRAATAYRPLLNAFHDGVKRAATDALVVTASVAPSGAVRFWRAVLKRPARFDVLAQHPDPAGGPTHHARGADDIGIPDMGRLRRLLQRVHHRARLWATDISFSAPPAMRARWLEHAFELLWRAGVDTVTASDVRGRAAETAFRFPFVAGGDQVWTRAPAAGALQIRRNGRVVKTITVRAGEVVLLHGVRTRRGDVLRGALGPLRSLSWHATH
jgi:hypothetical protein